METHYQPTQRPRVLLKRECRDNNPPISRFTIQHTMSAVAALEAGATALLGFVALHLANEQLAPFGGCLCPPLGAVAVLLFSMGSAPASQPAAVLGGHLVAGVTSLAVMASPISGEWYAKGVAVALTIVFMKMLDVTHPPGCKGGEIIRRYGRPYWYCGIFSDIQTPSVAAGRRICVLLCV